MGNQEILYELLPIRTADKGNEDPPWQVSPNKAIRIIAEAVTGETISIHDVSKALKDTSRKYWME